MLEKIDDAFVNILEKKEIKKNLRTIELVLSNSFDKDFRVVIINPKRNAPFYMMSIFPEESTLDKLVQSILDEESDKVLKDIWNNNNRWTIEIDNRLLTGSFIDVSSKELTSLVLHECGHVKQSRILGPLYLFVIGIPSIIHAALPCKKCKETNYYHFYTEKWANKLMGIEK